MSNPTIDEAWADFAAEANRVWLGNADRSNSFGYCVDALPLLDGREAAMLSTALATAMSGIDERTCITAWHACEALCRKAGTWK